jgi:hypothetical protein
MNIPSNYRKLKPGEIVRKGDLYQHVNNHSIVSPVKYSIGHLVGNYPYYTFWRRRHVKATITQPTKTDAPKKAVAIVSFNYPGSHSHTLKGRTVQVISLDDTYLVGLEITNEPSWSKHYGKRKYQFKKYRRDRISLGQIYLESFGPPA